MPAPAPSKVTERTTSTAIRASRQTISTFVTRSTPFCRPRWHTKSAIAQATNIQNTNSTGLASMVLKSILVPAASMVARLAVAIFGM